MEPSEDILVVALTSHGSPDGLEVTEGRAGLLSPRMLKGMLDASGATYRIVVISACYSGVFAKVLADPRTLVITAAAADRPSFGCEDGAIWTYFGDAFYNQALRRQPTLEAAFADAKRLVTERERRQGYKPSNPQIAGGSLEPIRKGVESLESVVIPCAAPESGKGASCGSRTIERPRIGGACDMTAI